MIENTILKQNREGRKGLVFSLRYPSSELVELAATVGFDAVHLDGEHGAFTRESVDLMCRMANGYGLSVTARVPSIEPWVINLYLDRGVQGIWAPHIETGEQARRLVDACLLPPDGRRSWGTGRGTEFHDSDGLQARYGGRRAFAVWSNANLIVAAQIESEQAYRNLDDILAVEGLTAIMDGVFDLAASLGYPGEGDHPEVLRLTAEIEARTRDAGKRVMRDMQVSLGLVDLMLDRGREFIRTHRDDRAGP